MKKVKEAKGSEKPIVLAAEEGASLSSGSLRLYYLLPSPEGEGSGVRPLPSPSRSGAEGEAVGAIDLYAYDPLNRRCAVGIMVATEHRRQGHALAMLQALTVQYRGILHTLYADIAATNGASLALFAKAGYTQCGRFKEWLNINGQYIDSIRMQKTIS